MFTTDSSRPVEYRVDFRDDLALLEHLDEGPARSALEAIAAGTAEGIYGALITGPVGVGKTYAARALMRARGYADLSASGAQTPNPAWVDWPEFVEDVYEYGRRSRSNAPSDWQKFDPMAWALRYPGNLFLDDVGAEQDRFGEAIAALQRVVAQRCKTPRMFVLTSNLSLGRLSEKYGDRTVSRLMQHVAHVELAGADRRLVTP